MGMTYYPDYESVPSEGKLRQKLRRSLFPPSDEEKQWMQLEKCMRCLPQDENTGGFFVATIMKLQEVVSIDGDDNSETDFELSIEYKEEADKIGIIDYKVCKCVNSDNKFIEAIKDITKLS